jgi:hypothetical protein|nr:MAG TPA: hypothetical protein [Podoviridae sp. ctK5Q1]DAO90814.1 MAG TPA: hypothetical protein [Caudoviricetes sp.]DAW00530.1 MAG TPA: hypothetical protein [Caudoviricetes sp.]
MANIQKIKKQTKDHQDIYDFLTPPGVSKEDTKELAEVIKADAQPRPQDPKTATAQQILEMLKPSGAKNVNEYLDMYMQQSAITAANRLEELVNSENEKIATQNVHYVLDHVRGKAIQRSVTAHAKVNIQDLLD